MNDDQSQQRLAAIGEIAAEIAHELRNTLQVIAASAYLARQAPGESLPHIQKIERNARMAHGIVDDLMALARGEPAHAEAVLFAEIVVAARVDIDSAAAVWEDEFSAGQARVRAHPGLATRLLHVLYENAILASAPRAPTVRTRLFEDNREVVIEVSDDGPGIPAEIADRIFEPLVTARPGGTGLGLALARRIAAAHGGSIAIVPSPKGACFRIVLPRT